MMEVGSVYWYLFGGSYETITNEKQETKLLYLALQKCVVSEFNLYLENCGP